MLLLRGYKGTFNFKQHQTYYEYTVCVMIGINWCGMYFNIVLSQLSLFLFRATINVLLDPKQNELSYWENFIYPILAKLFDDIMSKNVGLNFLLKRARHLLEYTTYSHLQRWDWNISSKTNETKSDNTCNEVTSYVIKMVFLK